MPPAFSGLPVTQAVALMSVVFIRAVLVGDPGHLALAGAHVGGGHVLAGVDQVALDQFVGEAAGDQLQLVLVPLARVDAEPALGAAERHLDQRAFVGHQRRQRLDLVLVDAHAHSGCRP